ncbi:hypothetical protein GMD78_09200 [Ornithinibacillus sp. L9]|uniref:GyrI-like small molecule binding domain-containing protein n=1 Tax=Ornithinibacillus caprae TaxID=2678566 RepID=A0A6N8FGI5_9BACI|nr:GyrI-like domain-containing protein [Ornithinibacillus caprae]MUK88565.1 hypothetical protein [Ornithinibacillus caprae]
MKISTAYKNFQVVGIKFTGRFKEYPSLIPKANASFKERYQAFKGESEFTRAIVYEPMKSQDHEVGFFYIGALVDEPVQNLPDDMENISMEGDYVFLRHPFDVSKMGEFYTALDNWMIENGKSFTEDFLVELYYPNANSVEDLEVYMPYKKEGNSLAEYK